MIPPLKNSKKKLKWEIKTYKVEICQIEINWIFFFSLVDNQNQLSNPSAGKMNKNYLVYNTGGKSIFHFIYLSLNLLISLSLSISYSVSLCLWAKFSSSSTKTTTFLFRFHIYIPYLFITDPFFLYLIDY